MSKTKWTEYSVSDELALDLCRALGLDPNRISRMKFDFKAGIGEALIVSVEYLPHFEGGLANYQAEEKKTLEDLYCAYEA